MRVGYNKIFWGFIFVTFNINVGNIQVLPKFIAYIIIYFGIESLIEEYKVESLQHSRRYCSILVFMSFFMLGVNLVTGKGIIDNIFLEVIWTNAFSILEIIMVYKLLTSSSEILKSENNSLYEKYDDSRDVYLVLSTLVVAINNINLLIMSETITILAVLVALSLRISIIVLNRRMYKREIKINNVI